MTSAAMAVSTAPQTFIFYTINLRVIMRDGEPWFVAADVCAALDLGNATKALLRLDDDETQVIDFAALNSIQGARNNELGNSKINIINESGLYSLILGSRKPQAKKFKKWVTSEVLPAIRKTGAYIHRPAMQPGLTIDQQHQIMHKVRALVAPWLYGDTEVNWALNHLRVAFQVARWQDIPETHFDAAMALLANKEDACWQFLEFISEARDWFRKEVMGGGQPWTPAIQGKLSHELKRRVILPPKVDWLALAKQTNISPLNHA